MIGHQPAWVLRPAGRVPGDRAPAPVALVLTGSDTSVKNQDMLLHATLPVRHRMVWHGDAFVLLRDEAAAVGASQNISKDLVGSSAFTPCRVARDAGRFEVLWRVVQWVAVEMVGDEIAPIAECLYASSHPLDFSSTPVARVSPRPNLLVEHVTVLSDAAVVVGQRMSRLADHSNRSHGFLARSLSPYPR